MSRTDAAIAGVIWPALTIDDSTRRSSKSEPIDRAASRYERLTASSLTIRLLAMSSDASSKSESTSRPACLSACWMAAPLNPGWLNSSVK